MAQIFVNYRRRDTQGSAGHLADSLRRRFGRDNVFLDVGGIDYGEDFEEVIEREVGACAVLVAVIGPRWLTMQDKSGRRRIDDPKDYVRFEIASALRRGIPVYPVLVEDATMPDRTDLPSNLRKLATRNAIDVRHTHWDDDVEALAKAIERVLRRAATTQPAKAGATTPASATPQSAPKSRRTQPTPTGPTTRKPQGSRRTATQTKPRTPTRGKSARISDAEVIARSDKLIPARSSWGGYSPRLYLVLVGTNPEPVLRPSELEDVKLYDALRRDAVDGPASILDPRHGTRRELKGDSLLIIQENASVRVDELGTVTLMIPARHEDERSRMELHALIEEDLRVRIRRALRFGARVLKKIDLQGQITHVLPTLAVLDASIYAWRTRAEHAASPTSGTMGSAPDRIVVRRRETPITRADLEGKVNALADDLLVLLRRQMRHDR